MNRATDSLPKSLESGWAVQIYSRDRHLLCSLYPSHGWAFLAGITLGFIVTLVGVKHQPVAHPVSVSIPIETPLNLD